MNTDGRQVSLEDVSFPGRPPVYATLYAGEDEDIKALYDLANAVTENVVFNDGAGLKNSFFYFDKQAEIDVVKIMFKTSASYDLRKYYNDSVLQENMDCFIRIVVDLNDVIVSYNAFSLGSGVDGFRSCLGKYESVVSQIY